MHKSIPAKNLVNISGFTHSKKRLTFSGKFHVLFLLILMLFSLNQANATIYYVSSSTGSDANTGTSESVPWKTLTKVNSLTPKPGDQILFKRGDEWTGTITVKSSGTSGNPIVYGAYGSGNKPKIFGSETITGWTLYSGNIYKATTSSTINQLFLNNIRMKAARHPNSGYAIISTVNASNSFTCNSLNSSINYKGAKWVGRTVAFATVTMDVIASTGNTLTISEAPFSNLNIGEGFILVNKLEFLDSPGEWYFDSTTRTIYLWTPYSNSPANYSIIGSTYDNGFVATGKDYITIKDFDILYNRNSGIVVSGSNNIIDNNTISYPDSKGIEMAFGSNTTISNNIIRGANHAGIFAYSNKSLITDNQISDIFLFDNIGVSGSGDWYMGSGINIEGDDNSIKYNTVNNTGYNGIQFNKRNVVEYNYVTNALLTKDDGGGIYSSAPNSYPNSTTAGSIIRHNIVDGVYGTLDGWSTWVYRGGHGIFLDENAGDVTIEYNTVVNCSHSCIFLHYSFNENIRYNTLMNARRVFLISTDYGGTKFTNNIVYTFKRDMDDKDIEWLVSKYKGDLILNYNTYISHYNSTGIFRLDEAKNYDFAGWKSATGQDANSTIDISPLNTGEKEEIFYNNTKQTKTIELGNSIYRDIYGRQISGTFTLEPFTSRILIKTTSISYVDNSLPTITSFLIPASFTSLTIPISVFTASDNVGVTGYMITETSAKPLASDAGWTTTAPSSYTFSSTGTKTLFAWAKDAAGNVSASASASVTISTVTFSNIGNTGVYNIVSMSTNLRAMPVTFTESGNITSMSVYHEGGSGNLLMGIYSDLNGQVATLLGVTSATAVNSAAGWQTVSLASPVAVASGQTVWLAWIFQNSVGVRFTTGAPARAVSTATWTGVMPASFGAASYADYKYSIYCTLTQGPVADVTKPVISVFTIPPSSSSLIVPVTSFNASDNIAVTGYKLTESATAPLASDAGWTTTAPSSYTFSSTGTKTLFAWAKDAAGNVSASASASVTISTVTFSNIGNTGVYNIVSMSTNLRAMPVTFTESGNITSMSVYHEGGSGNLLMGIYSDLNGQVATLLGVTSATAVNSAAGWQTVSLASPVAVATGQTVWLAWIFQNSVGVRFTTGAPARAVSTATWTGVMPASFGAASYADYKYSIYCTYTPGNILKDAIITTSENEEYYLSDSDKAYNDLLLYTNAGETAHMIEPDDFKVYPNPAHSFVNIEFDNLPVNCSTIEILDMNGKSLIKKFPESKTNTIEVNQLPTGMYILRVNHMQNYKTKKLIIK